MTIYLAWYRVTLVLEYLGRVYKRDKEKGFSLVRLHHSPLRLEESHAT